MKPIRHALALLTILAVTVSVAPAAHAALPQDPAGPKRIIRSYVISNPHLPYTRQQIIAELRSKGSLDRFGIRADETTTQTTQDRPLTARETEQLAIANHATYTAHPQPAATGAADLDDRGPRRDRRQVRQVEALITTARLSTNPNDYALVALLGLLGPPRRRASSLIAAHPSATGPWHPQDLWAAAREAPLLSFDGPAPSVGHSRASPQSTIVHAGKGPSAKRDVATGRNRPKSCRS